MSEVIKTVIFAVSAVALAAAAYVTQPRIETVELPNIVGKTLFGKFDDPSQAASLEILRYDEELGEIHTFKVAKNSKTGVWAIPSHSGYPADAEVQMRDAALSLVGLKVIGLATQEPAEHEMYGVVEPSRDTTKLGDRGVGIFVGFWDEKGSDLAQLIIGGTVRDAPNQRFVRVVGQDPVYVVEIDPEQLSTEFEDWIEKDLLQLNAFDIEQLTLKDYSIVETAAQANMQLRSDVVVDWDADANQWQLDRLLTYRKREAIPTELLPNETLDADKLNAAKEALDDLKIVDVRRKPRGLGADLRADESFMGDAQNRMDLQAKGFYANPVRRNVYELLSANGEIHVLMKDGYRYILRFGGVEGTDDESNDGGLTRYLFVSVSLDEVKLAQPQLTELPSLDVSGDGDDVDEEKRRLVAEREKIEKENQRTLDEWNEEKEQAQARVNELNSRFADWYYVIAEDVYRKVHLGRSDIIVAGDTAPEDDFGVDAFRQLEAEGITGSR